MPGMTIDESARRLGEIAWVEGRLFEVVGQWVATTPDADLKLVFARESRRHGEHAVAIRALLPDTRDHDPGALVAPGPGAEAGLAELTAAGPDGRVRALAEALRTHLAALDAYLGSASPVRDGPGIRLITAVGAEDRGRLGELEANASR
jgi:hypothetical protein